MGKIYVQFEVTGITISNSSSIMEIIKNKIETISGANVRLLRFDDKE